MAACVSPNVENIPGVALCALNEAQMADLIHNSRFTIRHCGSSNTIWLCKSYE